MEVPKRVKLLIIPPVPPRVKLVTVPERVKLLIPPVPPVVVNPPVKKPRKKKKKEYVVEHPDIPVNSLVHYYDSSDKNGNQYGEHFGRVLSFDGYQYHVSRPKYKKTSVIKLYPNEIEVVECPAT
jgi:hypothetical protein